MTLNIDSTMSSECDRPTPDASLGTQNEGKPAIAASELSELKISDLKIADFEAAIAAALKQAQLSCEQHNWPEVIASCQRAIAYCSQPAVSQPAVSQPAPQINNTPVPTESLTPESLTDATKAELYEAKGDLFERQGQLENAIEAFEQAVGHHPEQVGPRVKLAALYVRQQQWALAVAQYEQALALDASLSEVRNSLAEGYVQQAQAFKQAGDVESSVSAYLQALRQQPRLFSVYSRLRYNLMRYDLPKGDPLFQEIAEVCQSIVSEQPALLPARVALGYALTKMGQLAEAIECFRQVGDRLISRQLAPSSAPSLAPSSADSSADLAPNSSDLASRPLLAARRQPDFMIIGAEKCGTTSLYQYLRQHPAVLPPIEKEIDFFDTEYEQGIEWYLSHFPAMFAEPNANAEFITGETSANYLYNNQAPARIFKHFPQIKLAVILRDPIDRTLSRYSMMVRNGAEKRSFEVAIAEEIDLIEQATTADGSIPWPVLNRCRHIGNSLYYHHLERWLTVFPRQQLLVLKSEDLFLQPAQTLKQLYETLGIADNPKQIYEKHNVGSYRPLEDRIRQPLADFFAPHTQKLETLLGQSFQWDHTPLNTDGLAADNRR